MELIIGIVLAIIVLIIIGLILRKRAYDYVDRTEAWKLDIMARHSHPGQSRPGQPAFRHEPESR